MYVDGIYIGRSPGNVLDLVDIEPVVEAMFVLCDPATRLHLHDGTQLSQFVEHLFDVIRRQAHLGAAIALLVATRGQRVQRQRIVVGRRDGLFDQCSEDANLDRIERLHHPRS